MGQIEDGRESRQSRIGWRIHRRVASCRCMDARGAPTVQRSFFEKLSAFSYSRSVITCIENPAELALGWALRLRSGQAPEGACLYPCVAGVRVAMDGLSPRWRRWEGGRGLRDPDLLSGSRGDQVGRGEFFWSRSRLS